MCFIIQKMCFIIQNLCKIYIEITLYYSNFMFIYTNLMFIYKISCLLIHILKFVYETKLIIFRKSVFYFNNYSKFISSYWNCEENVVIFFGKLLIYLPLDSCSATQLIHVPLSHNTHEPNQTGVRSHEPNPTNIRSNDLIVLVKK